jgi:hypothetical protein
LLGHCPQDAGRREGCATPELVVPSDPAPNPDALSRPGATHL